MATFDRDRLEQALDLARQLVARLEPISDEVVCGDPFALRLAQAHALGLVDQLAEMSRGRNGPSSVRPSASIAPSESGPLDEDVLDG